MSPVFFPILGGYHHRAATNEARKGCRAPDVGRSRRGVEFKGGVSPLIAADNVLHLQIFDERTPRQQQVRSHEALIRAELPPFRVGRGGFVRRLRVGLFALVELHLLALAHLHHVQIGLARVPALKGRAVGQSVVVSEQSHRRTPHPGRPVGAALVSERGAPLRRSVSFFQLWGAPHHTLCVARVGRRFAVPGAEQKQNAVGGLHRGGAEGERHARPAVLFHRVGVEVLVGRGIDDQPRHVRPAHIGRKCVGASGNELPHVLEELRIFAILRPGVDGTQRGHTTIDGRRK